MKTVQLFKDEYIKTKKEVRKETHMEIENIDMTLSIVDTCGDIDKIQSLKHYKGGCIDLYLFMFDCSK